MRKRTVAAEVLLWTVALLVWSPGVLAAGPTVVYPTGQWPADVDDVQAAANAGGRILLKAVNASGVPTAFNFGSPDNLRHRGVAFEVPVEVSGGWVALACGISTIIGVGFGFYPARKAARLDPIDALRYE